MFNEAQGQVTITWTAGLSGTGEGIFLVNGVSGNFELAVGVTTGVPRYTHQWRWIDSPPTHTMLTWNMSHALPVTCDPTGQPRSTLRQAC